MQSPLLGFNNNVRHRGRIFHIQTEDSGIRHPHVITHLFMDGGRILKSIKTSYAEHLGSERLAQRVRDLMKEQHKTMFIALRDGQFDHVVEASASQAPRSAAPATHDAPPSSAVISRKSSDGDAAPVTLALTTPDSPVGAPPEPAAPPLAAHRPLSRREAPELFSGSTMDTTAVNVVAHDAVLTSSKERPSSGRYAVSRPAALFTAGKAADAGGSIFGEDLICEQSLDEVILSYLADDLDSASPKK